MKKKIITIAAFLILAVTTTFAGGNDISKNAQATFSASFAKATNVSWETADSYYKASFVMNGQALTALVSEEGKLIAVSRNILSTTLPVSLQVALIKEYAGYWISNLVEYDVDGETMYFITMENADHKTVLESIGTYGWDEIKRTAK